MVIGKQKKAVDFCTRPLLKKIIFFTIPLILTSLLQLLYNAADIIVLGRFAGTEAERELAVAAVGSTSSFINLTINVFLGLSVGALTVVARYIGAKNEKKITESVHTAISVSVISGLFVGIFAICITNPVLRLMGTPDNVLPLSALYLRIYFCGMPFNLLYNFGSSILRASGDTRKPLLVLSATGIVNVALNLLLVAVFDMGVAGVGIATTASQVLSALGVVFALMKRKDASRLELKKLTIKKSALIDIIKIGLPAGIQGTIFSLSNVLIQSSVNSFGKTAMAGNAAGLNIESFVYAIMNAFSQACLTFSGQNYGAGKPKNIDLALFECFMLALGTGLFFGVGMYIFATPLLKIYGCSQEAIGYGTKRLFVIGVTYFLCGVMDVVVGAIRGSGRSVMPMLVTVLGVCGVRVIWLFTIFKMYHSLTVLYISYPVSWFITVSIHLVCYLKVRKDVQKTFAKRSES